MKVRATILVEYEIDDESLQEAYGTTEVPRVLAKEKAFLRGDGGQGDYLHMTLDGADRVVVLSVLPVTYEMGDLVQFKDSPVPYQVIHVREDGRLDLTVHGIAGTTLYAVSPDRVKPWHDPEGEEER